MANKEEIVGKMLELQAEIEQAVSALPEQAWTAGVYEGGWNARELLAHIASMSGPAGFILNLAKAPAGSGVGAPAGFNIDDFNRQQVSAREGKSPADFVSEIKTNFERDMNAVRDAPDYLLTKHFRAPWDVEGEVGDVIVMSLEGHLGMHLADLRSAAR
ncbi:MAG TPA: maleylpyruvate isomerase N-terminal domain-containing protein [Dehalococcoidia bacterium]|jgi:hypothetical protein|nr:maleylpyruvate isomerase N-terminal domain-containing protein [Dehalococcoidia bacterium]